jgi:hypothetical protein
MHITQPKPHPGKVYGTRLLFANRLPARLASWSRLGYINPVGDGSVKRPFFPIGRTSETPMCRRLFDINTVGTDDAHSAYRLVPVVD